MFTYESLEIWKLSIEFAKEIYKITRNFPKTEIYGLSNQLQRAAVSISANIAEGSGSTSTKDKLNYHDIAIKSALEITSELQIAFELGYIDEEREITCMNVPKRLFAKSGLTRNFYLTDIR